MISRLVLSATALFAVSSPALAADTAPLRAGIPMSSFARNSASEARTAIEVFLKHVFSDAQIPFAGVVYESDAALLTAIREKEVDLFAMHSELYIKHAKKLGRPILVTQNGTQPVETLLLIAKKSVRLSDLESRSLVIDRSARGDMPLLWISDNLLRSGSGASAGTYFEKIETVHSASKALLPVYFGKQDAAILSKTDYDLHCEHNPAILDRLHVVADSDPLAVTVLCLRGGYTDYRPHDIADISDSLTKSEDGRRFLKSIGATKLAPFKEEYLHYNRQIHNRTEAAKPGKEGGK